MMQSWNRLAPAKQWRPPAGQNHAAPERMPGADGIPALAGKRRAGGDAATLDDLEAKRGPARGGPAAGASESVAPIGLDPSPAGHPLSFQRGRVRSSRKLVGAHFRSAAGAGFEPVRISDPPPEPASSRMGG